MLAVRRHVLVKLHPAKGSKTGLVTGKAVTLTGKADTLTGNAGPLMGKGLRLAEVSCGPEGTGLHVQCGAGRAVHRRKRPYVGKRALMTGEVGLVTGKTGVN